MSASGRAISSSEGGVAPLKLEISHGPSDSDIRPGCPIRGNSRPGKIGRQTEGGPPRDAARTLHHRQGDEIHTRHGWPLGGGLPQAGAKNEAKRGKPLAVPMVDLAIEIKNTSDKPVQVWTSGDPVVITLDSQGEGALNLDAAVVFTQEFRLPKSAEVPAGKSFVIPLKSLVEWLSRSVSMFRTGPSQAITNWSRS